LPGRCIVAIRRRAKYLLIDVDVEGEGEGEGNMVLLVHLGMTGRLGVVATGTPFEPHDHVIWKLNGSRELRFNDARRFGLVEAFERRNEAQHHALRKLGVEPLGAAFTGAALFRATRGGKRPVKSWLMDSGCVAGVGNIYASEALYRARVHPATLVGRLSLARCRGIVRSVRATLRAAIVQGGTTLRDFRNADGEPGYFAVKLGVYGREHEACRCCGHAIRRIVQAGRSTFYCPGCQVDEARSRQPYRRPDV
jgi:formamidopyrimidine-DNA glycosylase